jgi:hypothetical protein
MRPSVRKLPIVVMAGPGPAIHVFLCTQDVDARDKRGHHEGKLLNRAINPFLTIHRAKIAQWSDSNIRIPSRLALLRMLES